MKGVLPLLLLLAVTGCSQAALRLQVLEGPEYRIDAETDMPLTLRFTHNVSDPEDVAAVKRVMDSNQSIAVIPKTEFDWMLQFLNSSVVFSPEEVADGSNKTFVFSGYYWGYFELLLYGTNATNATAPVEAGPLEEQGWLLLSNDTMVVVDRNPASKVVDNLFVVAATSFMLINTVNMGCALDLQVIMAVLKKPIGPCVGVVSQFIFMPLFSFTMGWVFLSDPLQRLGLFTLGCSPGGAASNFWTLLYNGDINLSITMTFISTIIAMGMMPFWMATIGTRLLGDASTIKIPYLNLVSSLIMLTIPLAIGLLIKYKKKSWARISGKIVKPMTFCMVTFFMTVGIYNSRKAFALMTWNIVVAGCSSSFGGYTFGALLSLAFCLKKKQIIAISIETAFQNAAIAYILLKLSLPTPDSDLAAVPVLAQLIQTGPPLMLIYVVWQVLLRVCGVCKPDGDNLNPGNGDQTDGRSAKQDEAADVSKSLMDIDEAEAPRTPGLLYDPSMPQHLRQSEDKIAL